ncbi:sensor histidine kinase [Thiovibrio frasassiensis]|uniref:histidine kinase n=1 Tax=Thiovibrio frasassiensis TaxID=2984131 RepID=A0A9X4RL26_9BACT|nr:ATP-binding protein [Thiovibrio frasassiensis]MDG4475209.1 histidine kinase [Thiovibrio frasassiensis]
MPVALTAFLRQAVRRGRSVLLSVPLKLKILGLALALILLFGAVTIYKVQAALSENIEAFLREESRFVATELSYQSHDYLLINDVYGLTQMLRNTVQNRPDLRYVFVRNGAGQVVAHTFEGGFPADLLEKASRLSPQGSGPRLLRTNEGGIWEATAGISNGNEGAVVAGVKGDSLRRQIGVITGSLARTTLLVAVFGVLLSLGLTWIITRPVGRLLEATRAVRRGDYSVSLAPAESQDELGKLLEGFNAMVLSLASADKARLEKEHLQRDFLHRVMAGQEGERKRIARELHDQTGQALASVMVDLKMLENAKNETEARQSIGRLRKAITEEMEAIHNLAVALRPSVLDDLGLVPAVEMLVRGFITRQEIPVELTIIGFAEKRPDGCTETCVYRIVQEALSNVARHARATEVSVLLEWRGENIRGVIEDNGIGFEPERVDSKTKLGVLGMKERAQLLQGTFRIESGPGDGTMLVFEMPAKAGVCHEQ